MEVHWDYLEIHLPSQPSVRIEYDILTDLPILQCFNNAEKTAKSLTMTGCVTDELNQNITNLSKLLLQWHFKLGHIGFTVVKWIGRQGYLGKTGEKFAVASVGIPKCAASLFGK